MSRPLGDCVIALAGRFELTHGELAKQIKENGGKHVTKITDEVTHLVVTASRVLEKDAKVMQATQFPQVKLVNYQWLGHTIALQQLQDEATYEIDASVATNAPSAKAASPSDAAATHSTRATSSPISTKSPAAASATAVTKGKKRARNEMLAIPVYEDSSADEEDADHSPTKKRKDGQKAKSSSLRVPVDEHCPLAGTYRVYIDGNGIIYDASLNQTSAGNNHNKYYRVQLLVSGSGNYKIWTRWGRVGAVGAHAIHGDGSFDHAIIHFEKKFKEKSGNTWENRLEPTRTNTKKSFYTFIERRYEDDSTDDEEKAAPRPRQDSEKGTTPHKRVESRLPKQVQSLMQLIFNKQYFEDTMKILDYDAEKLPLGQLSKRTLEQGFRVLKELGELLASPMVGDFVWTQRLERCSDMFYTLIPHNFGRQRPPVIRTEEALRKEITLMESLSDMEIASTIMKDEGNSEGATVHPLDRQFAALDLQDMVALDHGSPEHLQIEQYLMISRGSTHDVAFQIEDIFRIQRKGEAERFSSLVSQDKVSSRIGCTFLGGDPLAADRRLLWHGSRCTNFGGILSQGLRIAPPEAPVSGYAFGKGVYLADSSSKSANYCHSYTSGDTGLLLLCEVLLKRANGSKMLELEYGDYNAEAIAKQNSSIATWGKGKVGPKVWKDAVAELHNGELAGVLTPDVTVPYGDTGANGYLQYNEYIVYDIAHVKLQYLLRVKMT